MEKAQERIDIIESSEQTLARKKAMTQLDTVMGSLRSKLDYTTGDQEVWAKDRIRTAFKMVLKMQKERRVAADEPIFNLAMEGLVEGTAVAVMEAIGKKPSYINLRSPYNIGDMSEYFVEKKRPDVVTFNPLDHEQTK